MRREFSDFAVGACGARPPAPTGEDGDDAQPVFEQERIFQRVEHKHLRPRLVIPMEMFEASNLA